MPSVVDAFVSDIMIVGVPHTGDMRGWLLTGGTKAAAAAVAADATWCGC